MSIRMVAKTLAGLEEILAGELEKIGASNIVQAKRAVSFEGDLSVLYCSNYLCRTALKVLVPIKTFHAANQEELYRNVYKINWSNYMRHNNTIAVDSIVNNSRAFNNSMFVNMKVKDAIVDHLRDRYKSRPSVDPQYPDLRINVHINKEDCTISLDSSGESLHKRGYKTDNTKAPLNEVLAAGLIMLSNWDTKSNFVDPMCGSGTLLTEACMIASNTPPSYFRKRFNFMKWKHEFEFNETLWNTILDDAEAGITPIEARIFGSDSARSSISIAKDNLRSAGFRDLVNLEFKEFQDTEAPEGGGIVIINPPYGEKLDKDDVDVLYKQMGDTLKTKYKGYDAWIISSNLEAVKKIGLKASRKIEVFNGPLECRFLKYEMYAGTRDKKKLTANKLNTEEGDPS